jgi:dipeptidyl aminopeptidase/acylaminoacyl peptidase
MDHAGTSAEWYSDLARFAALPRMTGLACSPDGARLVAVVQEPDEAGARYVSALWEIPLDAASAPQRLTRSATGESSPAFAADGRLLFVSARAGSDSAEGEPALWQLPEHGEPELLATRDGGLGVAAVARKSDTVIASGSELAWTGAVPDSDRADAQRRRTRAERKITAILHTGMPIRHWDHELGETSPRLLRVDATGQEDATDLTPGAGQALHETSASISDDGTILVSSWRTRRPGGRYDYAVVRIDVGTAELTVLLDEPGVSFTDPQLSGDGRLLAVRRADQGSFEEPMESRLQRHELTTGTVKHIELGDLFPREWAFSADAATLFVAGDLLGRGAVVAIDAGTGQLVRRLVCDATYSSLCPSPDGRTLYALRSAVDEAPTPVRLDTTATDQEPVQLPTPAPTPPLPGRLLELDVPSADGARVHSWLCLPNSIGDDRAPVMQWIHGGPFSSYNSWSWRWNPWVAVARGYAVIMPDPALSTGYGPAWIARAWPHRAEIVWADVEAVLDQVVTRPDIDGARSALLGASFGGYMTNWVAGHTGRFDAIVTHAGLWALDQQHTTTDNAQWKTGVFGTPAQHPDWYAQNSPHRFVDKIGTPMLVVHGNRDYRVPISEALRLWWDLVRHFGGDPRTLPHRFLQLTGENHWVNSPANVQVWYETVLGFCDQHVRGLPFVPSALL